MKSGTEIHSRLGLSGHLNPPPPQLFHLQKAG
jgi:hypothetical protein